MYGQEILGLGEAEAQTVTSQVNHQVLNGDSRNKALAFITVEAPHIAQKLTQRQLKLQDAQLYATTVVTRKGETLKFVEQKLAKEIGVRNIHQARLEKDKVFLISQIQLLACVVKVEGNSPQDHEILTAAAQHGIWRTIDYVEKIIEPALLYKSAAPATLNKLVTAHVGDDIGAVVIGSGNQVVSVSKEIDLFPALENGELTLEINKKKLIEELPLGAFKRNEGSGLPEGAIKLDNPRLIADDTDIKLYVELPSEISDDHLDEDEYIVLKAVLIGSSTVPA
jgi:hypothetical protein